MKKETASFESLRVLVVDDYMMMRTMISQTLRQLGVREVDLAANGREAYDLIGQKQAAGQDYDIVFMDWNMPVMTGAELLQLCRQDKRFAKTAFVMLTAEREHKNIVQILKQGAAAYIIKPVSAETMEKTLRQLTGQRDKKSAPAEKPPSSALPANLQQQLAPVVARGMQNIFSELFHIAIVPDPVPAKNGRYPMVCVGHLRQENLDIQLRFYFDQDLLRPMLAQLYSPDYLKKDEVFADAAGEIVNILCSQVKAFLNENGYRLTLDIPHMQAKEEKKDAKLHPVLHVHFTFNGDRHFLVDIGERG